MDYASLLDHRRATPLSVLVPDDRDLTDRDIRAALNALLRTQLAPIAATFSGLFFAFTVAHLLVLPPAVSAIMSPTAGATSLAFFASYLGLQRLVIRPRWAHPIAAGFVLLVLANSLLHMYVAREPHQTTNIVLLVLGIGMLLYSRIWGALLIAGTVVAWTIVIGRMPAGPELVHFSFMLVSGSVVALLVLETRIRMLQRLARLHHCDARRAALLADTLAAARRSEAELAQAQQLAHVGSWSWDAATDTVTWSDELARIYGGPLDPASRGCDQVFARAHPADRATLRACVAEALQHHKPFTLIHRIVRPDGQMRVLLGCGRVILSGGKPVRLVGTAQDITEQQRAEDALRGSEARWRSLVENAPDAIMTLDRQGRILYVNRVPDGLTSERVIGSSILQFTPVEQHEAVREAISAVFERGDTYETPPAPLRLPGLPTRWYQSRFGPIVHNGTVVAAIGISTDVTERKRAENALQESEARFRALLESAPDAMIITEQRGRIVLVNAQTEQLFGYPRAELLGQPVEMLVPERFRAEHPGHREDYATDPRARAIGAGVDLFGRRRDGTEFPAEISLSPIASDGGVFVAAAVRDVSERQKMMQELAMARDAALESSRLKSAFLANMSHEVRTPLNAILGTTSLLLDCDLGPEPREYVNMLRSSGKALLAIVNDILDFSKIEAGKLTFETTEFDVRTVVGGAIELLSEDARAKGLNLASVLAVDVPSMVHGDPGRLSQTLLNLIGNAVRFTAEGEVLVRVTCERAEADHVVLRFAVSDTGIGISEEAQQYLFQPFSQVDGSSRKRYGGTGLGLAISKHLAEGMGGTIGLRSAPGTGSTFWFTARFTIQPAQSAAENPPTVRTAGRAYDSPAEPFRPRRPVHVLIAEDNAANRTVLLRQLVRLGYFADAVTSGAEVIPALAARSYDAILLDCNMPGMDGYETTALIRNIENGSRRTPIIAVTAYARPSDRERCLQAGMDDYVSKPVDESELARALQRWTDRPSDGPEPPGASSPLDPQASAYLRALHADDADEYFVQVVEPFLIDTPARLAEIEAACRAHDGAALVRLTHALNGVCALLGARRMARLCRELEAPADPTALDAPERALAELRAEFDRVRSAFAVDRGDGASPTFAQEQL